MRHGSRPPLTALERRRGGDVHADRRRTGRRRHVDGAGADVAAATARAVRAAPVRTAAATTRMTPPGRRRSPWTREAPFDQHVPIVRRPPAAAAEALTARRPVAGAGPRLRGARHPLGRASSTTRWRRCRRTRSLRGIDDAAARLVRAIDARERILIVADYDADGATACAVGVRGLRALGADVDFVVPNRFEYGYGLTPEIVALAAQREPHLLVTVDNGIASVDGVAAAAARGIDVLVTDHHLPGPVLPTPAIIVNPNQPGCAFPSKHIAGVGVMFYVLAATRALLRARGAFAHARGAQPLRRCSTWSRSAPSPTSCGSTRPIARSSSRDWRGCAPAARTRASPRCSTSRAATRGAPTAFDLGFVAGPRLNAAGRLADMSIGIRCLLADRRARRCRSPRELDRLNRERRDVEATMQEEALADLADVAADATDDRYSLCVFRPDWHQGVVGIVAVAPQGPVPPADDRVRARRPTASCAGPAGRSPASTCATRWTSSPSARPACWRTIRRPRVRGRPVARRIGAAGVPRGVRDGRPRPADAGRSSRGPARPTARSPPGELTLELARVAARPGLGPGLAGADVRRHVRRPRHADRRRQAHEALAGARRPTA